MPGGVWPLVGRVREAVLEAVEHIAPGDISHIFTSVLADNQGDLAYFERLRDLAARRGARFVPVWLTCDDAELRRRLPLPERRERLKIIDPALLDDLQSRLQLLPPAPDALVLDTSRLGPEEAARRIMAHAAS